MKQIILVLVFGCLPFFYSCKRDGHKEYHKASELALADRDKIAEKIIDYFKANDYNYDVEEDDPYIIINSGFEQDNEDILIYIFVNQELGTYQIFAKTETSIPEEKRNEALRAINNYNMKISNVGCTMSDTGHLLFFSGGYIDNKSFSAHRFDMDMGIVMKEADLRTAQIYKEAMNAE